MVLLHCTYVCVDGVKTAVGHASQTPVCPARWRLLVQLRLRSVRGSNRGPRSVVLRRPRVVGTHKTSTRSPVIHPRLLKSDLMRIDIGILGGILADHVSPTNRSKTIVHTLTHHTLQSSAHVAAAIIEQSDVKLGTARLRHLLSGDLLCRNGTFPILGCRAESLHHHL